MRTFMLRRAGILSCALLLASGMFFRCEAQTTYGSVVGTARDPSGAVVVGAHVTVTNEATGVKVTQETNDVGAYSLLRFSPVDIPSTRRCMASNPWIFKILNSKSTKPFGLI